MIALLVVLAAVSALLLTAAVVLVRIRQRPASLPNAFRCKVAVAVADGDCVSYHWPSRLSYAVWVHDVLIVFDGFARTRVRPLAVHFAEGAVATMVRPARGLGSSPVVMAVEIDDGDHALVAAPRSSGTLVAGPFLAALLTSDGVASSTNRSSGD